MLIKYYLLLLIIMLFLDDNFTDIETKLSSLMSDT